MDVERMNRRVLALDNAHPARRFLIAFIDCRENCVGRHHGFDGRLPVDQAWKSASDGKTWTFSEFAYKFLSFDIELDGFLQNAPYPTESETDAVRELPRLKSLMDECARAARHDGNHEILELTEQVLEMFSLYHEYLAFRKTMTSQARD
jgi:hypothetical protein